MLEEALKAMLTSLPLVSELHHPAMRSRHWTQLMRVRHYSQHPGHSQAVLRALRLTLAARARCRRPARRL